MKTNQKQKVTALELSVLELIANSEYLDAGSFQELINAATWSATVTEDDKEFAGALGSLVKKGLVGDGNEKKANERTCWITEKGVSLLMDLGYKYIDGTMTIPDNDSTINNQKKSETMSQIKLNDLKKAGKELNGVLFDEKNPQIDVKASEILLKDQIMEAATLLEDGEEDQLTEVTQNVLQALREEAASESKTPKKASKKAVEPEAEETDDDDAKPAEKPKKEAKKQESELSHELAEQIIECDDLTDLKRLVKSEEVFADLRKGVGIEKDIEKLRAKMLAAIGVVTKVIKAKPEPIKKEVTEKKAAAKKEKTSAYNRVDAVCDALKKKPKTIEDWVELADSLMEMKGGKSNKNENRFIIRYVAKMAPHFDFGVNVPTA